MKLFVANATRQQIEFHYRMVEDRRDSPYILPIPIGQQRQVHGRDLSGPELEYLIEQLQNGWGAVEQKDLDRTKDYIGVFYTVDRSAAAAAIEKAVHGNLVVLEKRGEVFRRETAIAASDAAAHATPNLTDFIDTTTTIEEDVGRTGGSGFSETIRVESTREGAPTPKGGRKRKAA